MNASAHPAANARHAPQAHAVNPGTHVVNYYEEVDEEWEEFISLARDTQLPRQGLPAGWVVLIP